MHLTHSQWSDMNYLAVQPIYGIQPLAARRHPDKAELPALPRITVDKNTGADHSAIGGKKAPQLTFSHSIIKIIDM